MNARYGLTLCSVFFIATAGLPGCSSDDESSATTDAATTDAASARAAGENPDWPLIVEPDPQARAMAAKNALFEKLSARLMQAMSTGGPAAAIEVCSREAPAIAEQVSKDQGVRIGRTSFKLRNASNRPPEWAQSFVDERTAEPQFLDLPDGRFAALLPIRIMPQCITCHGPEEQIAPEVLTALKSLYPDDQATGFALDDLRGWFWIEVPAAAADEEQTGA